MQVVLSLLGYLLTIGVILANQECKPRDFGYGGTVCVCSADYCDTVDPVSVRPGGQYIQYTSSRDGLRFKKTEGNFTSTPHSLIFDVRINADVRFQTILGFGGAFTDSTGININLLKDPKARDLLMKSYFSDDGLQYNLCRVPIGGTDFSTRGYTYDDIPDDKNLLKFNLTTEDYDYKIPYMKQALTLTSNKLSFFGSAWTAPAWMKSNDKLTGGFLLDDMYQVWANYYVKFLEAYAKEGINFWGLTTGNEPSTGFVPFITLNSMGWTVSRLKRWMSQNFGPTIKNKYPNMKLMILDDQRIFLPWIINELFEDSLTQNYTDGVAVHWYLDKFISPSKLDDVHTRYPSKFILETEACISHSGHYRLPVGREGILGALLAPGKIARFGIEYFFNQPIELGSWQRGEQYANNIIQDLQHWVTGWIDWNMVLDPSGGPTYIKNYVDAPIIVNKSTQEFFKQPTYYTFGHFTKFIPPGSIRIAVDFYFYSLQAIAFLRPDNGTVVILFNDQDEDEIINLVDKTRGNIPLTIKQHSISTILYW